jgi:hypothetical protein
LVLVEDKEELLPVDDASNRDQQAGCCMHAVCSGALYGRSKSAWMTLAAAQIANTFGDAAWSVIEVGLHQNPFPSVADVCYLMFYPLFAIGVYLLPVTAISS